MISTDYVIPRLKHIEKEVEDVAQGLACLQGYEGEALNRLTQLLKHIKDLRNDILQGPDFEYREKAK
ncbi:MAG: hypothetical protein OXC80_06735 [Gammaproteobacteria bacterium]|nr:hypothetical protein [Gammaproteobacteria bacterium]